MIDTTLEKVRMRLAEIPRLRKALDIEEAELRVTERNIVRIEGKADGKSAPKRIFKLRRPVVKPPPNGNRGRIIEALQKMPGHAAETPINLNDKVRELFGERINPNSLHPILADLKEKGVITRDGSRVVLKGD